MQAEWTLREHHWIATALAFLAIFGLCLLPAPANAQIGASGLIVVDGDTIKSPSGVSYRIMGMDTPETFRARSECERRMGLNSKAQLERLLSSGAVTIEERGLDKYRRTLAIVRVDGRDVSQLMVASGHARAYDGKSKRKEWC